MRHGMYFWNIFRAAKYADSILALDPVSVGFPALMAARLRRKKFVVKIVGDYAWEQGVQRFGIRDSLDDFVRRAQVPFRVAIFRAIQTHVAMSATHILVPSEYLKKIVMSWGIQNEKIEVIYNAIELEEDGVVPAAAAALLRPLIVTAGRLVPWKGMDALIDAVASLPSPASLVIVGDGPDRTKITAHAQEKLSGRAVLTGALSHADTLAVMRSADMFVLNSSYEGLSHVLIEALMLGKPIIATNAGGNVELISHEENGMLVPVNDANALKHVIEMLITNPSYAHALGERARADSVRFSLAAMLSKTAHFLETI